MFKDRNGTRMFYCEIFIWKKICVYNVNQEVLAVLLLSWRLFLYTAAGLQHLMYAI